MTHELATIFNAYSIASGKGVTCVLATVVALEGSSYRRPGVRMLLTADGKRIGAVSGGCVEKEIQRQAQAVFKNSEPRMMTYDGRYRLGCEGILHILLEPFEPSEEVVKLFDMALENRTSFKLKTVYSKVEEPQPELGTIMDINGTHKGFRETLPNLETGDLFTQEFRPRNQLFILGAEHDSVALCRTASTMGWEVTVVAQPEEEKTIADFPGAKKTVAIAPEMLKELPIDVDSALMVMSHNFARDVAYLLALSKTEASYIGLLGPASRREQVIGELLERQPEIDEEFIERLHGPAGIDIGAETAQEIAISVMGEILSVFRNTAIIPLRDKKGSIHN